MSVAQVNRWTLNVSRVGLPEFPIDTPELRPKLFVCWIELWISRHCTAYERPNARFTNHFCPHRIRGNVKTDFCKRVPLPLFLA